MTYPLSDSVAVVNVEPPSLEIEATISVFKVVLAMFSWNTTIRLVVGAELAVKAFETIVVLTVTSGDVPLIITAPLLPGPSLFAPEPFPKPGDKVLSAACKGFDPQ